MGCNYYATTPSGAGSVEVAGKVAELLLTYSKRPSDVYFDLLAIEDFFDTKASDYGISPSNVASRVRCVETVLSILFMNRGLWSMASDHLLATGAMTFTDAQTYLASCSGERHCGHSAILAFDREGALLSRCMKAFSDARPARVYAYRRCRTNADSRRVRPAR